MSGINKKIVIIAIFLVVALISVTLNILRYNYELSLQFEDQNGESKDLCLITGDLIEDFTEDYRAIKRNVVSEGLKNSGVLGKYEDCDNSYTKTKIGMLSGIYVCNAVKGNGMTVEYTINSIVNSGNLRIVVTDENNHILVDVPIDSNEIITFKTEVDRIYYVKFVGESANIEIELWRLFIQ